MQGTYQELSNSDLDFGKLLGSSERNEDNMDVEELEEVVDEDIPFIDGANAESHKLLKSSSSVGARGSMSCAVSANYLLQEYQCRSFYFSPALLRTSVELSVKIKQTAHWL